MSFWTKKADVDEEVSFQVKCKRFMINALIVLVMGMIYAGIGFLITYWLANRNGYLLQDAGFIAGCLIVVLSFLTMMHGNHNGTGLSNSNASYSTVVSHWLMESNIKERDNTDYYKNFRKHAIVEIAVNRFAILLGGILLIAISILFL